MILVSLVVFASAIFYYQKTEAGVGESAFGWLWGGSDDGAGNSTGLGWISMNNTTPGAGGSRSYGVDVPVSGSLSGYAWSENVGWVSFNFTDLTGCPDGNCSAQRVGDTLTGWARIMSIKDEIGNGNTGGWQGWIKLNGTASDGTPFGVKVISGETTVTLSGYAWSDELGAISFSGASLDECIPTENFTYSCVTGSSCGPCGDTETTNYWTCIKKDSCGNLIPGAGQPECIAAGANSDGACKNEVCAACVINNSRSWTEVAP